MYLYVLMFIIQVVDHEETYHFEYFSSKLSKNSPLTTKTFCNILTPLKVEAPIKPQIPGLRSGHKQALMELNPVKQNCLRLYKGAVQFVKVFLGCDSYEYFNLLLDLFVHAYFEG